MEFSFKPIIVLTAAVAMVAGCQRENLPDSPSVPQEGCQSEQEVRTFTVFSESRQPQDSTRTYLGGSLSDASRQVLWNKGDNLYVTDGSSGGKFTVTSESGSTKAVIEGSIAYSKWYSSVYPYSIVSSYGKDGFSVNLPSVQTYYPDGVSPDSYPMVALCDNDMFRFKNVCGIFVLQLKGDGGKVSGISFSGRTSDGKEIPVAGAATLALQSGSDPTLSFAGGASTSVTLDCSGASSLPSLSSTPTAFHIVLPYGTYDSITLSITLTDGRTMTVNSGRPLTIHRSGFTLAGSFKVQVGAETGVKSLQLEDLGTIPYICAAQTKSIKCLDMSYDILEKELGIDYAEFLATYTWEESKTYYLKSGKMGTAKDDFAVSELYGTIEFIKDSSIGALNDRFELTVFKAQADKIGIGSNKVLYAHFTNENGKKDVYIGFKITIADAAKVVFGDKNPSYWFNDIAGENHNTVRINVKVPNYWMTGSYMNDDVTNYSKDLRDNFVGNIVTVKLDQTADNYNVYKNLGNLDFKYYFQFSDKQPKINGNTLIVKNNGTEIWVENTKIITLDPTTSVVRYQRNDVSKKYLNLWSHKETDAAKMLYCNIDLVATYGECKIPCGTTTFHARFLRPITIMSNSEALLKCSTAIGGSIEIGNLFNAIDWQFHNIFQETSNGYEPCYYPNVANPLVNWYGYYGLKTLKVDIDNIKTDQTGIIQNIKVANSGAELWLSPKNDVMTSITPTNVDISNISNLKDYVLCYSDRAGVTKDFKLYIPIEIEYAWGTLVENVIVPVERSFCPDNPLVEYVDLGLSVKWATCNLGASKPEEYGGQYQWAGTKDVSSTSIYLDWSNCPYHTGSSDNTGWTKYNTKSSYGTVDNKTVLDSSDDAAHVNWGGSWRMPTDAEWTELRNNCTWTWTTMNGTNGYKVTSKTNGNSIYLPAAGYRYGGGRYGANSYGEYWSSSLATDYPNTACSVYFYSDYVGRGYHLRYYGQSVRPVSGDIVRVTGVSLNQTSLSLEAGGTYTLSATVAPSNAAERSVSWSSSDASVATVDADGKVKALKAGSATVTVRTTDGGYTATCKVTVASSGPGEAHEYVDLGLSVKWASCNVGASKPEEYGGYYQWAGTKDVSSTSIYLDWSNCPYHTGSSKETGWTKYNKEDSLYSTVDNKTVLDSSDDAAHVNWGGSWRMPTDAEWTELRENCTWTLTTQNGVNGYRVTSKKSGYTNKSIFLPAAGYRGYDDLYGAGSYGEYWSSSLYLGGSYYACYVYFFSGIVSRNDSNRYDGRSVRPVSE